LRGAGHNQAAQHDYANAGYPSQSSGQSSGQSGIWAQQAGQQSGQRSEYGSGASQRNSYSSLSSVFGTQSNAGSGSARVRGNPPKGYKKSDQRLQEDLSEALMDEGIDCANVDLQVTEGVVKLSGEVVERSDKFRIEQIAAAMSGIHDVENQLRMARKDARSTSDSTLSSAGSSTDTSGKRTNETSTSGTGSAGSSSSSSSSSKKY